MITTVLRKVASTIKNAQPVKQPIKRTPATGNLRLPVNPMHLLHGIARAEYSVPDEQSYWNDKYWTRTRVKPTWSAEKGKWVGSSTAYGPNQLTDTKFNSYVTKQYRQAMRPHRRFYYSVMQPMYEKFRQYGMEPNKPGYHPRWNYGGYGRKFTMDQKRQYRDSVAELIRLDYNEVLRKTRGTPLSQQGKLDSVIKLWRGKNAKHDPTYYQRVNAFLRSNYPEYYERGE